MFNKFSILVAIAALATLSGCKDDQVESNAPAIAEDLQTEQQSITSTTNPGWLPYAPEAPPPPGWTGKVIELSLDFPETLPTQKPPFLSIDFQSDPKSYWESVREYIYEGNINRGNDPQGNSLDWNTQTNAVRTWYNMPWRSVGPNAREFINGLTREFPTSPGSLDPSQKEWAFTWARAIYNPVAAYTVGQVWNNENAPPDMTNASFAEGAVIAKLLFTTAVESNAPAVKDSYTWQANTYAITSPPDSCTKKVDCPRQIRDVHLYQIDFAVKDSRASETQWVFGTFVHDPTLPGEGFSWDKMVPLGFMWGNDPELNSNDPDGVPQETVVFETHIYEHMGCHGRLSGPLDNPRSSCIGCHMNAQYPRKESPIAPSKIDGKDVACDSPENEHYWINLKSGDLMWPDEGAHSLDYSMEMTTSVENYFDYMGQHEVSDDGKTYRVEGSEQEYQTTRRHE